VPLPEQIQQQFAAMALVVERVNDDAGIE